MGETDRVNNASESRSTRDALVIDVSDCDTAKFNTNRSINHSINTHCLLKSVAYL